MLMYTAMVWREGVWDLSVSVLGSQHGAWHVPRVTDVEWHLHCSPPEVSPPLQYLHAQLDMGPCRQVCASSQMLHKLAGKPLSFMHVRINELIAKHFSHDP